MPTSKPGTFLRGIPPILGHANERASSRPRTWLRHVTPLPATCHGNYIPRDSNQLDKTLPKKFSLALFKATLFLILWPCHKIFGWTSFGSCVMTKKEAKRDSIFTKGGSSDLRQLLGSVTCYLSLWKDVSDSLPVSEHGNPCLGEIMTANKVFWLRIKAKRAQNASSYTGLSCLIPICSQK